MCHQLHSMLVRGALCWLLLLLRATASALKQRPPFPPRQLLRASHIHFLYHELLWCLFLQEARNYNGKRTRLKGGQACLSAQLCAPDTSFDLCLSFLPCIRESSRLLPGLPWWPSGWDSALQGRDTSSIPGWGTKIPHPQNNEAQAPELLKPSGHNYWACTL